MKFLVYVFLSLFTVSLLITPAILVAAEAPPSGRQIALKMYEVDSSQDSRRDATMLIERSGQKLLRRLSIFEKRYEIGKRSLTRFIEPADVRDTQYLSWTYDAVDTDDDLWVFFPSENLIRRISGGGKKGTFMRSDFANEDIEQRAVDDDVHEFLAELSLNGAETFLIESVPIPAKASDSNYASRRIWVDKRTWLALQIEFYDRRGRLVKRLNQGGIEQVDGIWTATKLIMETPRKNSRTLMQYGSVRYNIGLEDRFFEQSALKR